MNFQLKSPHTNFLCIMYDIFLGNTKYNESQKKFWQKFMLKSKMTVDKNIILYISFLLRLE